MSTAKGAPVTATRGNVVFCNFGADGRTAEDRETDLSTVLTAVGTAVSEIHADAQEILGANLATAQLGVDNSNMLFVTLGKIDNIAFHSNAIAANSSFAEGDPCGISMIADEVRDLVNRSAEATRRLRALVAEQRHVTMAAGSVLRDISEQVAELEARTRARIDPVCAQMREVEAANFTNYASATES